MRKHAYEISAILGALVLGTFIAVVPVLLVDDWAGKLSPRQEVVGVHTSILGTLVAIVVALVLLDAPPKGDKPPGGRKPLPAVSFGQIDKRF